MQYKYMVFREEVGRYIKVVFKKRESFILKKNLFLERIFLFLLKEKEKFFLKILM